MFLDTQYWVIRFKELFLGTIDSASIYPRQVAKQALSYNSPAPILVHNHPSVDPDPSDADRRITHA